MCHSISCLLSGVGELTYRILEMVVYLAVKDGQCNMWVKAQTCFQSV